MSRPNGFQILKYKISKIVFLPLVVDSSRVTLRYWIKDFGVRSLCLGHLAEIFGPKRTFIAWKWISENLFLSLSKLNKWCCSSESGRDCFQNGRYLYQNNRQQSLEPKCCPLSALSRDQLLPIKRLTEFGVESFMIFFRAFVWLHLFFIIAHFSAIRNSCNEDMFNQ